MKTQHYPAPRTGTYVYLAGWRRIGSTELERLCEFQRIERLLEDDEFHYRKQSVFATFWYYRKKGESTEDAYKLACRTQLTGLVDEDGNVSCDYINVDSRTRWQFKSDKN